MITKFPVLLISGERYMTVYNLLPMRSFAPLPDGFRMLLYLFQRVPMYQILGVN